jgi:hypothetical protein
LLKWSDYYLNLVFGVSDSRMKTTDTNFQERRKNLVQV